MLRLTLLGRALALIAGELLFTAAVWALAAVFLSESSETVALALLAWTIGLRHGLDADHISAIDNATRGLLALDPPQVSVLCGLWFSLGHSTIVIVVNVAIAVSVDVYDKLDKVGSVGGIVGAAVSASFLFLIGLANSIILYGIIRRRRRARDGGEEEGPTHTIMMRILGPVTRFVDRPWKMYPVGVLFGFGFDTASTIALLAITAVAQRKVHQGAIAILPFLFTAGMSLVDSLDSVLMVYSYAGFPEAENRFKLIEGKPVDPDSTADSQVAINPSSQSEAAEERPVQRFGDEDRDVEALEYSGRLEQHDTDAVKPGQDVDRAIDNVKKNAMSNLSIVLTIMSILVAFSISLITTMGLIGENCKACREAAESDPGLSGRWWRAWAAANEQSGYIGAAIVGAFLVVVVTWYAVKYYARRCGVRL